MGTMKQQLASPRRFLPFSPSLKTREAIAAYLFLTPFLIFFAVFFVRAAVSSVEYQFQRLALAAPRHALCGCG